jgi:type IV secretion system protein VirB9
MHKRFTIPTALLCAAAAIPVAADTGTAVSGEASPAAPASAAPAAPIPPATHAAVKSAGSGTAGTSVSPSDGARHANAPASALPPASVESATLFQGQLARPLSRSAFEDAASTWAQTGDAPVLVGTNGAVMYAYGQSHPSVTCAPLRICVINLIAHEHITSMSIGDSVRWLIQSADAGAGNDATPVVITKPTEPNLVTNLAITTDAGRVYYLTLHSDQKKYVPQIGFYDPQQIIIRLQQQRAASEAKAAAHQESVIDDLGTVDPAALDFHFTCKAENRAAERWLPVRVFAAGGHTYLQMPDTLAYGDAPALFNLVETGHHTQTELINSRLLHGYYVIDGLPARFKLIVGAGKTTRAATCSHG